MLFDRGRRGGALEDFDICGNRDRFNVFEVLITGAITPRKELLDRPVIGGPCVRVADRDCKKFEELLAGGWAGAGDERGSCKRIYRNNCRTVLKS